MTSALPVQCSVPPFKYMSFTYSLSLGFITVYVSLRRRVRRILNDLYCLYFLSEVMVKFTRKARGHFVTLNHLSSMWFVLERDAARHFH